MMLYSRHLIVELLYGRVLLAERLSLLKHREVQGLVTSPHQVRSGETTKGQGDVNLHARKENGLGTGRLT
jgi:hypothetical protein